MFTRIALQKLNELLKLDKFIEIAYLDEKNATLLFEDRACNISSFGNVTWSDNGGLVDDYQAIKSEALKLQINQPPEAIAKERAEQKVCEAIGVPEHMLGLRGSESKTVNELNMQLNILNSNAIKWEGVTGRKLNIELSFRMAHDNRLANYAPSVLCFLAEQLELGNKSSFGNQEGLGFTDNESFTCESFESKCVFISGSIKHEYLYD